MSKETQVIMFGEFGIVIPIEKMFDVVTLKIDLRPTVRALQEATTGKRATLEVTKRMFMCRKGCSRQFVTLANRRRHETRHDV